MSKTNVLIPYIEVENKIVTIRKLQVIADADADVAELCEECPVDIAIKKEAMSKNIR